jgi:transcriptional regulator with XRE-family HTH domain
MLIGQLIRSWREKQRLGHRIVAKEIGISPATLARIETGKPSDGDSLVKVFLWAFKNGSKLEIGA